MKNLIIQTYQLLTLTVFTLLQNKEARVETQADL